jgi:hypothetical protein
MLVLLGQTKYVCPKREGSNNVTKVTNHIQELRMLRWTGVGVKGVCQGRLAAEKKHPDLLTNLETKKENATIN